MKILFCTGTYITGHGGVASYAHDYVNAFASDHDIIVVTGDQYIASPNEATEVITIPKDDFRAENCQQLLSLIEERKPDLIVNSYFPLLTLLTPYLPDNVRVINISHFMNGQLAWAAGYNGNYADHIVALSRFNKSFIENKFGILDTEKTQVIFNHMPSLPQADPQHKQQANVLKIVYPGGHAYAKSAEIVCLALKQLLRTNLNFEFYWLGNIQLPGANWPFSRTRYVSDCLPADDPRICHIGPVNRDEAKRIIADANIFLLPSRGEGCPITLLEAMRAGCIPIISDAPHGSLDIIRPGKTGIIVKQGSAKALYNAITHVLTHHEDYQAIYAETLKQFNAELSYSPWLNKMQGLLNTPVSHQKRMPFSPEGFAQSARRYKCMLRLAWLDDRLRIQPYHLIIFRIIRYLL